MRSLWIALLFSAVLPIAQTDSDSTLFPVHAYGDSTTRYINKSGKVLLEVPYAADRFSEGLARIWVDGKNGYIDRTGQVVIQPRLVNSFDFSHGLALFHVKSDCGNANNKNYYGFIDRHGKVVIEPTLYRPCNYWGDQFNFTDEGLALTQVADGWGFIDKSGKVVMKFEDARHFSESVAAVKINGKFGFVDTSGKVVIAPQFEAAHPFSEGLAAVKLNGKSGFINHEGKFVIEAKFADATTFSEGMAPVMIDKKWGYVDRNGSVVMPPGENWTYAQPFSNGRAIVKLDREEGYIDKSGKVVIQRQFLRTTDFRDGLAQVVNSDTQRWEVIDVNGNVIYHVPVPPSSANLNNPFVKVSLSGDVKWLESVARQGRSGTDLDLNGGLASHPKDLSTAAYARLGALGTPDSIAAIKRIEAEARSEKTITPEFVPLGQSAHPGWHFSDSQLTPAIQARSANGTTYAVVWASTMGDLDLFLISSKLPDDPTKWTRPKLIPNRFYRGLRDLKIAVGGNDKLILTFTQNPPPHRGVMEGTHDPGPPSPKLGPQQLALSIKAIEKDSDRDGWTDVEEDRLKLNPRLRDSDGDGIPDGADICPNAAIPALDEADEDSMILQRALFSVFGLGGSRYLLLVDDKSTKIGIWGYRGPMLYGENVKSWTKTHPYGAVFVNWRIRKKTADSAIVEIEDYEGPLAAGGQDIRLKKIGNEWFVYERRTTWVS